MSETKNQGEPPSRYSISRSSSYYKNISANADPDQWSTAHELPESNNASEIFGSKWPSSFVRAEGEVTSIKFSPNGLYLAASAKDKIVLYVVKSGIVDRTFFRTDSKDGLIMGVDFSPDSKWIAGCDSEGWVVIRSVETGEDVWKAKHEHCVRSIAFAKSLVGGKLVLAAGDWCCQCCLYDVTPDKNGKVSPGINQLCVNPLLTDPDQSYEQRSVVKKSALKSEGYVRCIAWDPVHPSRFAFGDGDSTVYLCDWNVKVGVDYGKWEWTAGSNPFLIQSWKHANRITSIVFRPKIYVPVKNMQNKGGGPPPSSFNPEDPKEHKTTSSSTVVATSMLAVGDRANLVTVRDLDRQKIVAIFKHTMGVNALDWSTNGKFLVTGTISRKVTVRDINNGQIVMEYTHNDKVMSVSFQPHSTGEVVAASSKDGMIAIRAMTHGQIVCSMPHTQTFKRRADGKLMNNVVNDISIDPNGKWLVSVDHNQELIRFDLNTEQVLDQIKFENLNIRSVACSSRFIVLGVGDHKREIGNTLNGQNSENNKVMVYDVETMHVVKEWHHPSRVVVVAIYDSNIVSATDYGCVYVAAANRNKNCVVHQFQVVDHDTTSVSEMPNKLEFCCEDHINSVVFSPWRADGVEYLATGDSANKVIVRTIENGRIFREWMQEAWVNCVRFSPGNGSFIAAGDDANNLSLYDVGTGSRISSYSTVAEVNCIAFNEGFGDDDKNMLLALGDDDNNITLRDIVTGLQVAQFQMHRPVTSIEFTQHDGGSLFVAADESGHILVRTNPVCCPPNRVSQCNVGLLLYLPHLGVIPLLDDTSDPVCKANDPHGHITDHPLCACGIHCVNPKQCQKEKANARIKEEAISEKRRSEEQNQLNNLKKHRSVRHMEKFEKVAPNAVTTTTLFHHLSCDQLKPIVSQLPLYAKICNLTTYNPRLEDYPPPIVSCLELALAQQDHLKLAMLCRLIDLTYDYALADDTGSRAKWMGMLAGVNDEILIEMLERSFVQTTNIANSARMNIVDPVIMPSHFYNPSWLFGDGQDVSYLFFKEDFTNSGKPPIAVESFCIGPPRFVEFAFQEIVNKASVNVFETEAMQMTIHYMNRYAVFPYYLLVSTFFAMLSCFTLAHMVRIFYITGIDGKYSEHKPLALCLFGFSLLLCITLIWLETKVMRRQGLAEYADNSWNFLQIAAYVMVISSSFVSVAIDLNIFLWGYNNILGCVAILLTWFTSLSYLRGFNMFASIIATLIQILNDMRGFFMLVLVLLLGGTAAIKVLIPGATAYNNFFALVSVWNMGINGEFELSDLEVSVMEENQTEALNGVRTMVNETHANITNSVAVILALLFGFLMLMVLMNQLIALMADSYDHVMENLKVETLKARGEVIVDVKSTYGIQFLYWLQHNLKKKIPRPCQRHYDTSEASLLKNVSREFSSDHLLHPKSKKINMVDNCLHPRWLHVLRPRSAKSMKSGKEWEGSLKAMRQHIDGVTEAVASLREEFDAKNERMDAKLSHVLRLLISSSSSGATEEEMIGREKMLRANRKLGMLRREEKIRSSRKRGSGKRRSSVVKLHVEVEGLVHSSKR